MIPKQDFPRLTERNHRVTSPATPDYNCIAWTTGDTERWWQPGVCWPIATPADDYGIGVLAQGYRALGFEDCADGLLEADYEKVALYGSSSFYTHAARQRPDGTWSSKLGRSVDIEHDTPDDVAGGVYGEVVQWMRRPVPKGSRSPGE
jgi:hypothetical protein